MREHNYGTYVKTLLNKVSEYNTQNKDNKSKQIGVIEGSAAKATKNKDGITDANEIQLLKDRITIGRQYVIDFGYDSNGRIVAVGIIGNIDE